MKETPLDSGELKELEAKALPANMSAQKAEISALIRTFELAEGKTAYMNRL